MTGPNEPEQLDPDNPFAGMMAELHKGRAVLTRQVEPWRTARVGDRVRMLDGWGPCVEAQTKAGVFTVTALNESHAHGGPEVSRLRLDHEFLAYNTHVVEIGGGNE